MELRARIFYAVFISSLVLYLSVEGLNILQPNSRLDQFPRLAKDQTWLVLDKALEVPVSPLDDTRPVSPTEPEVSPAPSPVSNQGKEAPSQTSLWDGISVSSILDEAQKKLAPVTSSIINEAEAILGLGKQASSPAPAPAPAPALVLAPASAPLSAVAPTIAKGGEEEASIPILSPLPGGPVGAMPPINSPSSAPSIALTPSLTPTPSPGPSGFFDHDVAMAIESRIKQSQTDSQVAMDEAKKLLNDPKMAASETGKCLSKCVDKYAASLTELNRAINDLGVRDVTLLADDFGAVEADIGTCQACFTENIGEDSPLKPLEEATTKAARECLTVMDYAS